MTPFYSLLAAFQGQKPDPAAGPAAQAMAAIAKSGGAVRPIAQNDEHLEVSFQLAGGNVSDKDLAPLAQLSNVVSLNLAKTGVTDAGLAVVGKQSGLTALHLELTKVTDAGLAQLQGLGALTYLNLFGTAVTDAGLEKLAGLKALRHLYVWQTKVTPAGARKLEAAIPGLQVNLGWEPAAVSTAGPK